jgi:hypothetical protein
MKIVISENQFKNIMLSEQSDYSMDQRANATLKTMGVRSDADYKTVNKINTKVAQGTSAEQAAVKMMMEIGVSLLPIVGNFIGALIGGYYAQDEFNKGNKKTGGLIAILSLLPLIPQIKSTIPSLSKLDKNGIKNLSDKLTGVVKTPLTNIERDVIKGFTLNKQPIQNNLLRIQDAVKNTIDYKKQYINTYGKIKFNELFSKLIKGELNKQQYIDELVGGLKDTYNKVDFKTIAGIKFFPKEEEGMINVVKQIQSGGNDKMYNLPLIIDGVEKKVLVYVKDYPKNAFDMAAKNTKDIILVNYQNIKNFSYDKLINTLAHEAAHIKDLSYKSTKMANEYESILRKIDVAEKLAEEMALKHGPESAEVFAAKKMYVKYFTKYQYHYQEMLANNSKVMQSLSRNIRTVIGNYGVPETQKMLTTMKTGLTKGIPDYINYYMDKFIGGDNANYIKQIKTFDKNLYKDLLKKLSKQIQYMEEQLKLYQQN